MVYRRLSIAAGLALVLCLGLSAQGAQAGVSCGKFGTSVNFVDSPSEAGRQAKKEQKLVFVLHVSGLFEDPKLT